ncbi:MAG: hypothetical protein N2712_03715 [Brevinematales bacterium]|nr:hypothetical protein [Brevinematales bacterium]
MVNMLKVNLIFFTFFMFISCASNGGIKSNLNQTQHKVGKVMKINSTPKVVKVKEVFIFDLKKIQVSKGIPDEIKTVNVGIIMMKKTNVTILVSEYHSSIDGATNSILEKDDVINLVFNNFVVYDDGKDSNKDFVEGVNIRNYMYKDDFNFEKSYIANVVVDDGREVYKTVSIYTVDEEALERNIVSAWEGICWDKSINLNITEKFMRLITSNYTQIKKSGKWTN